MKGQNDAIGSSSSESHLVEPQIYWTNFVQNPSTTNQETQNLSMWSLGESSSSSLTNPASQNLIDPPANMLSLGHNVTVNPSTFIGIKPANYGGSSSSSVQDARQLPHKRKATELTAGQSSSGNVINDQLNVVSSDPIIPRIDARGSDNNRRNVRVRINSSREHNLLPVTSNNTDNNDTGGINFPSSYASLGGNPSTENPTSRASMLRRNFQVTSRNRSSSSRALRPISSNIVGGSGDNSRTIPASISEHPLFVQSRDIGRNTVQTAIDWNLNAGVGNGDGSVVNNGNPVANVVPSHDNSSLFPSRRISEILRRSLLSSIDSGGGGGGQNGNLFTGIPPPVGISSSSSQETGIPPAIGIPRHHPRHLRPPIDVALGFPHLARTTGGSERRGRLVSEIRNVLDLIRRGEGLRFEDYMILDQSMFYGMAGIHDRHRDMRLDIDNMSYEELLALEERIGNVNTGLTEEKACKCLKQRIFVSETEHPDAEPCCICQEEYKNGDEVGGLKCGHDFHSACIKQWLIQKNACPVCKSTASK